MIKHHDHEQFGEKKDLLHLTTCNPSSRSQGRDSRPEPAGRNWSRGHGIKALTGLLLLPSYSTQNYQPKGIISSRELGPPTSIIYQEMRPRLVHRPIWWEHFLSWGSLFQNDSNLGQADIKIIASAFSHPGLYLCFPRARILDSHHICPASVCFLGTWTLDFRSGQQVHWVNTPPAPTP